MSSEKADEEGVSPTAGEGAGAGATTSGDGCSRCAAADSSALAAEPVVASGARVAAAADPASSRACRLLGAAEGAPLVPAALPGITRGETARGVVEAEAAAEEAPEEAGTLPVVGAERSSSDRRLTVAASTSPPAVPPAAGAEDDGGASAGAPCLPFFFLPLAAAGTGEVMAPAPADAAAAAGDRFPPPPLFLRAAPAPFEGGDRMGALAWPAAKALTGCAPVAAAAAPVGRACTDASPNVCGLPSCAEGDEGATKRMGRLVRGTEKRAADVGDEQQVGYDMEAGPPPLAIGEQCAARAGAHSHT